MELKKGYKKTDIGLVPNDWLAIELKDITSFITKGATPTTYGFKWENSGITFLRSECVSSDGLEMSQSMFISEKAHKVLGRSEIRGGDILITITGNVGRIIYLSDDFGIANINQHIARIRIVNEAVDKKYVFHFLNQNPYRKYFDSIVTGQAYPQISLKQVRDAKIYFPSSKSEQTAIATALSDADALITSLENLIAKKRNIKQGAMQQLLKPKKDWKQLTYGDVFDFLSTANYSRADINQGGTAKYIHYGDIHTKWDSFVNIENNNLPTVRDDQISGYHLIQEGDVIMADASEDYAGIGKCVEVINLNGDKIISGLHTFLMRDKANTFVNGFRGYIHSIKSVKSQFDRLATGLKVYGISKNNLKTVSIPVPPQEEQALITRTLRDIDAEISKLEMKLNKFRSIKQGMMQNLLTGKIRLV